MGFKLEGFSELRKGIEKKAKNAEKDIKEVVARNGSLLEAEYKKQAVFRRYAKKPTSTGNLRSTIYRTTKDNGLTVEVDQNTEYGGFVEFGTRKMRAQPYARPAHLKVSEKFIADLNKLTK